MTPLGEGGREEGRELKERGGKTKQMTGGGVEGEEGGRRERGREEGTERWKEEGKIEGLVRGNRGRD